MHDKCFGILQILSKKHGSRLYDIVTPRNIIDVSILRTLGDFEKRVAESKNILSLHLSLSLSAMKVICLCIYKHNSCGYRHEYYITKSCQPGLKVGSWAEK